MTKILEGASFYTADNTTHLQALFEQFLKLQQEI